MDYASVHKVKSSWLDILYTEQRGDLIRGLYSRHYFTCEEIIEIVVRKDDLHHGCEWLFDDSGFKSQIIEHALARENLHQCLPSLLKLAIISRGDRIFRRCFQHAIIFSDWGDDRTLLQSIQWKNENGSTIIAQLTDLRLIFPLDIVRSLPLNADLCHRLLPLIPQHDLVLTLLKAQLSGVITRDVLFDDLRVLFRCDNALFNKHDAILTIAGCKMLTTKQKKDVIDFLIEEELISDSSDLYSHQNQAQRFKQEVYQVCGQQWVAQHYIFEPLQAYIQAGGHELGLFSCGLGGKNYKYNDQGHTVKVTHTMCTMLQYMRGKDKTPHTVRADKIAKIAESSLGQSSFTRSGTSTQLYRELKNLNVLELYQRFAKQQANNLESQHPQHEKARMRR